MSVHTIDQAMQLAVEHHRAGRLTDAEKIYRQVLVQQPNQSDALHLLGLIADQNGRFIDAVRLIEQATTLFPSSSVYFASLSEAHRKAGNLPQAIAAIGQTIKLDPKQSNAWFNVGKMLRDEGRIDEAIEAYRQTIKLNPDQPDPHWHLSVALLLRGDFQQAWPEFEWRFRCTDFSRIMKFDQPRWNGEPLSGRRVLIHAEQGIGDTIQFIRYAPMIVERGGTVILACQASVARLMQSCAGVQQVVSGGQVLPSFDFHCPNMSLPFIFDTRAESIPARQRYLKADAILTEEWRVRLPPADGKRRVGLVWAGRPEHPNDHNRSMKLAQLAPLAEAPDIQFFSLQKGVAAEQLIAAPPGINAIDLTNHFRDFSDTAALISHLDLVITVDTAVAHLAGALGKPVWLLLSARPDWRWQMGRPDSPWYPTMRLFRQTNSGDWETVVHNIVQALTQF